MSERAPRLLLVLPDDLLAEIDNYRFVNRIETRTEAIRQLIRAGLEDYPQKGYRAQLKHDGILVMTNGTRMTLGEFFKREESRIRERIAADDADPEVQAKRKAHEAYERRMSEAEKRWAEENATTPHQDGYAAAQLGLPREPPEEMNDDDAEQWLEGYDSDGRTEDVG